MASEEAVAEARKEVLNDYSAAACGKHVTVYCWSRTEAGSARWQQAEDLGRALAQRGFGLVTGGYCGSMEAVSKGAREAALPPSVTTTAPKPPPPELPVQTARDADAAPVAVQGILVPGQFPDRVLEGNRYLTQSVDTTTLVHRLDILSRLTRYYIALPGTLGTLTEIAIIWSLSVLHKRGAAKPVILLFRDPWEAALVGLGKALEIPQDHMDAVRYVDSVDEAVAVIAADWEQQQPNATSSA